MCSCSWSTGWSSGKLRPASAWKRIAPAATSSAVPQSMNASEQVVGDQVARGREVVGAPGRGDLVAQVALEPGTRQGDVAEHGHHVDHERLALRPVERLAARLVDEREEVAGRLDGLRVAAGGRGAA